MCAELEDAIKKVQNEEIRIPFGVGIAGSVAQTKEVINITSAYEVRGQTFFAKTYIMAPFWLSFLRANLSARRRNIWIAKGRAKCALMPLYLFLAGET